MIKFEKIRQAVADYIASEGCSYCRHAEEHKKAKENIAKLLHVPMYSDKSGYNFSKFSSPTPSKVIRE